jgi:hypothetical protein
VTSETMVSSLTHPISDGSKRGDAADGIASSRIGQNAGGGEATLSSGWYGWYVQ